VDADTLCVLFSLVKHNDAENTYNQHDDLTNFTYLRIQITIKIRVALSTFKNEINVFENLQMLFNEVPVREYTYGVTILARASCYCRQRVRYFPYLIT
jgi:hypothetical protein